MAYVESNGHVLDDVTCPVFLFVTHCVFHATFIIDKITWKYRKTVNIIEKTSVYHTVNGDLHFHTSNTAKTIKVILLSSTLTF